MYIKYTCTGIYMHIHAHTCIYMHIHAYYVHIYTNIQTNNFNRLRAPLLFVVRFEQFK